MLWRRLRRQQELALAAPGPQRFSYKQVCTMTNHFRTSLGDGGFGAVFDGFMKDGTRVAVKVLASSSNQGDKEFKAEVVSMAGIHHKNVVPLRGYCVSRRILIYEFMANGSLDKWLFSESGKEQLLSWPRRFEIAMGVAKGLAYLHEECTKQIIHLDIKPENIVLDEDFLPKVTDFGLSKLVDRDKKTVVTNMRGTPGYLAPEWMQPNAPVSTKLDVYSYGIVLLELICGRESFQVSSKWSMDEWYLPSWAFRLASEGRVLDLVDSQLSEEVEYFYRDDAERTIFTAFACINHDPTQRPDMSKVVQMLEGVIEPPRVQNKGKQSSATELTKQELQAYAASLRLRRNQFDDSHSPASSSEIFSEASARMTPRTSGVPPLRGDVVTFQDAGQSLHAVVREAKPHLQQVRLGILQKDASGSNRWKVLEEEDHWRSWNSLVMTRKLWEPVRWVSVPGPVGGFCRIPVEWLARG